MRDWMPRIAGVALLVCGLVLLIFSPAKFSTAHLLLFLACFVSGILLITGIIGTHPTAAGLRREAIKGGIRRPGPLCHVPEQVFPYANSPLKKSLVTIVCAAIGLSLACLGIFLMWVFHSKAADGVLTGVIPLAGGILCLWIAVRYPSVRLQVNPGGITLRGYFRTVQMPWETILALIARNHYVLTAGGFAPTGILYSLYSPHSKLWFSSQLPGSERLASLVAEATGLTWNSI
jgi:hypothetical protein